MPSSALRAFDQRHHLTRELAAQLNDRVRTTACVMTRWRCCGNASIRSLRLRGCQRRRSFCANDPMLQIVADQKLGDALRIRSPPSAVGELAFRTRAGTPERPAAGAVSSLLCGEQSSPARRDSCSISTPPTIPPTASSSSVSSTGLMASICITPCWSSSVNTGACCGAPASGKRLQSCPHRAHAVAPGAAFAVCLPRREDQAARRCRFCFTTSLPVL